MRPSEGLNSIRGAALLLLISVSSLALAENGGDYEIGWWTIAASSHRAMIGDSLVLLGAFGQPGATGELAGGEYRLTGGFYASLAGAVIFIDGFESGGTCRWSRTAPYGACPAPLDPGQ